MSELKSCPFCGSDNLGISDKTTTISWKRKRHVAVYCKDCNCYGSRVIAEESEKYPHMAKDGEIEKAKQKWNTRLPQEDKSNG